MSGAGATGERKTVDRPPGVFFLVVGGVLLALNHLSVVTGRGVSAELLIMGCALAPAGAWVVLYCGSFEAVLAWSHRSGVRAAVAGAGAVAALIALASAVALVYGERLTNW